MAKQVARRKGAKRRRSLIRLAQFLIWLPVTVGLGVVLVPFGSHNPAYWWSAHADASYNAGYRDENATVVRAQGVVSVDGFLELPAQLRYVNFYGKGRTSRVYMLPYSDTNGSLEPITVGQDGSLTV